MTDLKTLAELLVAGTAAGGAVMKAFEKWEKLATESDIDQVSKWLAQPEIATRAEKWPQTFARLFDRVFGEKHLSWRCFRRSCAATLIACVICVLGLILYFRPFVYTPFPGESPHSSRWETVIGIAMLSISSALVLCLFDYVSLLETRFVLRLMQRWSSWYRVLILLLLDVVVTGVTGGIPVDLAIGFTLHPFQKTSEVLAHEEAESRQLKEELEQDRAKLLVKLSKLPEIEKRLDDLDRESADLTARMRNRGYGKNELQKAAAIKKERDSLSNERLGDPASELSYVNQEIAAEDSNQKSGFEKKKFLIQELGFWLPTFFTSMWLWLYAGCGFLLKAARRLDIGFQWFNRRLNTKKNPLQSLGVVAGAFTTIVWWIVLIVAPSLR